METPAPPPARHSLDGLPRVAQWAVLILVSLLLAVTFEKAGLPAALLIAPMLAGVAAGTNGATVRVPMFLFAPAQGIVGCLIAISITGSIVSSFMSDWPLFLAVVLLTLAASSLLGWLVSRWRILPGTTAVWGSAPGFYHVAIYLGGGRVVQALNPESGLTVTDLASMSGMQLYPYAARY